MGNEVFLLAKNNEAWLLELDGYKSLCRDIKTNSPEPKLNVLINFTLHNQALIDTVDP